MSMLIEREIISTLYPSRGGIDLAEELVGRFGARFAGTIQECAAAEFLLGRFRCIGISAVALETFECPGWTRKTTSLTVTAPLPQQLDCIALPYCPPADVTGTLVYLGDGDPRLVAARDSEIEGAIAMLTSATPLFAPRPVHRSEKIAHALAAGARGVIWMRGAPGGLAETGSIRFGGHVPVPVVAISYETGCELLRLARFQPVTLRIVSTNMSHTVTSHNVVAELPGAAKPDEFIVLGAHYDGHDIGQGAVDNASGVAVLFEAARALVPFRSALARSIRLVAFAQEEMGLYGASHHAQVHAQEAIRFMLNCDGGARSLEALFKLQGWPENVPFIQSIFRELHEPDVTVGDEIEIYADVFPFAARGIPAGTLKSRGAAPGASAGASRGFQHTAMDTLDKLSAKLIQIEAIRVASFAFRLANLEEIPLRRKKPAEIAAHLAERGLDAALRAEQRPLPGET
jgi:Iap family predicted aminopeptidase